MSSLYNYYYFNAPRILQEEEMQRQKENDEAWEHFETEMVPHRLIMDGLPTQHETMTRKVAEQANEDMEHLGWNGRWEEVKEPVHISEVLQQEYLRLQQSLNR